MTKGTLNRLHDGRIVGIDIGGTRVKLGLFDAELNVLRSETLPVGRRRDGSVDPEAMVRDMVRFARQGGPDAGSAAIRAVGVCAPGLLDEERGVIEFALNLGWSDLPLAPLLETAFGCPAVLTADAAAGAIGEKHFGAGRDADDFLYVCIGTGVGASRYRQPPSGGQGGRGDCGDRGVSSIIDLGHMSVKHDGLACGCGNVGCLEQYVSGRSIARRAEEERHSRDTLLNRMAEQGVPLDAEAVHEAAVRGDPYASLVMKEAADILGIGLLSCIHLFAVNCLIIGGGLSRASSTLLEPAVDRVRKNRRTSGVRMVQAQHPSEAGMRGAAVRARQILES